MTKLALIVVLPLVLLALTGVVIVDVRDREEGVHLVVPVPLALAQVALAFAPSEARHVEIDDPEAGRWLGVAAGLTDDLRELPDFTLVEVHDGGEHVLVRKEGDALRVEVDGPCGEQVRCRLPLRTAQKVLRGMQDGELRTADVLRAVQFMPGGELVHVTDDEAEVRITKL